MEKWVEKTTKYAQHYSLVSWESRQYQNRAPAHHWFNAGSATLKLNRHFSRRRVNISHSSVLSSQPCDVESDTKVLEAVHRSKDGDGSLNQSCASDKQSGGELLAQLHQPQPPADKGYILKSYSSSSLIFEQAVTVVWFSLRKHQAVKDEAGLKRPAHSDSVRGAQTWASEINPNGVCWSPGITVYNKSGILLRAVSSPATIYMSKPPGGGGS